MKKKLKHITDYIFYSNFWISLGAALMVWETYILLALPVQFFYILFAFCATLAIYNLDRLVVIKKLSATSSNERHRWIIKNKALLIIIVAACFIFLISSIFYLPWKILLFLSHLAIISLAYSIPFIHRKPLRSFDGLKIFLIAYVWMAATAMLPALAAGKSLLDASVISVTLRRGLFIFAITIPFDIRDLKTDRYMALKTIPGTIGIRASQWLAIAGLLLFVILAGIDHSVSSPFFYALLLSALTTAPFVFMAKEHFNEYFYAALLDGTIVLQFVLVYFSQKIAIC